LGVRYIEATPLASHFLVNLVFKGFAVVMRVTGVVGSVYTMVWVIVMVFLDAMKTSQKTY